MAEHLSGRELLPDSSSLVLRSVERDDHRWVVETSGSGVAACPDCGAVSSARHSNYWRHLKDLPLQGSAVLLRVQVGRWHCHNPVCERQIFCERLRHVTHKYAQETNRFGETVQMIGYALGGRPGERLSGRLGFSVSDDTLLRRVKQAAQFHRPARAIPVVGVDEWAWRKGYSGYGTILVDLKQRVVADLLPDRSAASFERWLKQHPIVLKLKTSEFNILTRSHTPCSPPSSCEELTHIALMLRERVDLGPQQRFRLVGVGLSNFHEPEDLSVQPVLFE